MNVMIYDVHGMNTDNKEKAVTMELLQAIEQRSDVTQRDLAAGLGVALGLANAYLKRCIHKGLVKVSQAPANRYLYYLTPKGFAEKSKLTAEYLTNSFEFYRLTSRAYAQLMRACEQQNQRHVILCGMSELAEIASLRAQENSIEILGVFDPEAGTNKFLGFPVWNKFSDITPADVFILTALNNPELLYQHLQNVNNTIPVLIPEFLNFVSQQANRDISN